MEPEKCGAALENKCLKELMLVCKHSDFVKDKLTAIVQDMADSSMLYVKNPEKDFSRNRKLPFETVMNLLISMGGNTLYKELMDAQGYDLNTVTTSAFVQRRDKILPCAFEFLLNEFTTSCAKFKKHQGYRLLAIDGSSLNISHDPFESETYFQNKPDWDGFNLLHLNALFDLCNRLYVDAIVQPGRKANEHKAMIDLVDRSKIDDKAIIVADRGYESYNNLAHIERKGWNYVIRVKDIESSGGFLSGLNLPVEGEFDVPVSLVITRKQTKAVKSRPDIYKFLKKASPFDFCGLHHNAFYPLSFRVVRFLLPSGAYEAVVTNLDKDQFPPASLREIYRLRWGIETSFRELKHTIGLASFHSKKREFITQEIFARLIMYNFVEIITSQIVISQDDRLYEYKVNFTHAVHICRRFLRLRANEPPLDVEALIRKSISPIRPIRIGQSGVRKANSKSVFSFIYRIA